MSCIIWIETDSYKLIRRKNTLFIFRRRLFPPPEEPQKVKEKNIAIGSSLSVPNNHQDSCKQLDKETHELNNHTENERLIEEQFNLILERNDTRENNNTNIDFENEITIENINPIQVFRSLEMKESGDIRNVNRSLQKQKLADENKIFRFD